MMLHPFFKDKRILVIDQIVKSKNDKTWCFWEQQPDVFENVVYYHWDQIDFYSTCFSGRFDLAPYKYKMIRSIDFYNHVFRESNKIDNIHFLHAKVERTGNENNKAFVQAGGKTFYTDYIFNSIILQPLESLEGLLQHFKGWLIETTENIFDERIATFMDFRMSQQYGTTFVYALPVAKNKAMIEYTVFSKKVLEQHEYETELKNYLGNYLKIDQYKILSEEFGVIPMTHHKFSKGEGRIVNIGTAGGQTKASSGFSFKFIQKHSQAIIDELVNGNDPHIIHSLAYKRFHLYDSTLLRILQQNKMGGGKIFASLFKKNSPQQILKFLDNETSLSEELKIMSTVPAAVFMPAIFRELFNG